MNLKEFFPFLSNDLFRLFVGFMLIFIGSWLLIGALVDVESIRSDISYIRKELQFEEKPIEPFAVLFVEVLSLDFGKVTEQSKDTLHLVCDPADTLKVMNLLNSSTTMECGLGHCIQDSVTNIQVELITD